MPTGTPTIPVNFRQGIKAYTTGDNLSKLSYDATQWEVVITSPTQLRTTAGATVSAGLLNPIICFNFGFNIPVTSIVRGVTATLNWQSLASSTGYLNAIELYASGTPVGTAKNPLTVVNTSPTENVYGGSTDLWGTGTSLTPAIINATNFGFQFQVYEDTVRLFINSVGMAITYLWNGYLISVMQRLSFPINYRGTAGVNTITPGNSGSATTYLN